MKFTSKIQKSKISVLAFALLTCMTLQAQADNTSYKESFKEEVRKALTQLTQKQVNPRSNTCEMVTSQDILGSQFHVYSDPSDGTTFLDIPELGLAPIYYYEKDTKPLLFNIALRQLGNSFYKTTQVSFERNAWTGKVTQVKINQQLREVRTKDDKTSLTIASNCQYIFSIQ